MGNVVTLARCQEPPATTPSRYSEEIKTAYRDVYLSKGISDELCTATGFNWADRRFVAASDALKDPIEGPAFLKEWENKERQLKEACPTCSDDDFALTAAEKGRLPSTDGEKLERAKKIESILSSPRGKLTVYAGGNAFARRVYVEGIIIDYEMLYKVWLAQRVLENRRRAQLGK